MAKPYHARGLARHAERQGIIPGASLTEEIRNAPFRSVLPPWPCALRDVPAPGIVLALEPGAAITPAALRAAADAAEGALAAGLSVLVLAHDKPQRDDFRDRLVRLLNARAEARRGTTWGTA